MHSKLFSRILVFACVIVMGGLAFLGGMTLRFSDEAWNGMVKAIASQSWTISDDVSISVDSYDSITEDITIQMSGTASSVNGDVTVQVFRTDDLGRTLKPDAVGETSTTLVNQYAIQLQPGGVFTTPDLHLVDGENYFLFVATDVNDLSAIEVVSITYKMGKVEAIDLEHMDSTDEGILYQNNIIVLTFLPGTTADRAREIIDEIGGTEVGNIAVLRRYQVKVAPGSYEDLKAQCETIKAAYPEISIAAPEMITMFSTQEETGESTYYMPNDPWTTESDSPVVWDEALPAGNNWGLECIQAQSAWQFTPYFRNITVGVIDGGFLDGHDDLRLYFGDDRRIVDDHGTHIAGTIAALHDNRTGVSGVMNKGRLFAYPLNSTPTEDGEGFYLNSSEYLYSLVSCVVNGSSVVNVSLGSSHSEIPGDALVFYAVTMGEAMATLLAEGYDFLVVQAAGNGDEFGNAIDAINSGWYIAVKTLTDPAMAPVSDALTSTYGVTAQELVDRVIVVGNAVNCTQDTPYFELRNSSNCGSYVDIAAPGTAIYSTVSGGMLSMGTYDYMTGTSMAAPHVAAVAAMAWSTNPDITGADVKQILLDNTIYTAVSAANSPMPGYEYKIVNAFEAVKAAIDFRRVETYANITVKDAETGSTLPGVSVAITRGIEPGGPSVGTFTTDAQGVVYVELDSGDYVLTISHSGYITSVTNLVLQPDTVNNATRSISRVLGENVTRISLAWGSNPKDLDAHLIGYLPGSDTFFRVYWPDENEASDGISRREAYIGSELFAVLDTDDRAGNGNETITIYGLPDRPLLYCVHDFTNRESAGSMNMSASNAVVQVMRHDDILGTFTVSPNRQSVEWILFWLMPDGSIVPVDDYSAGSVPSSGDVGIEYFNRGVR